VKFTLQICLGPPVSKIVALVMLEGILQSAPMREKVTEGAF
jgi:hypothetical protein